MPKRLCLLRKLKMKYKQLSFDYVKKLVEVSMLFGVTVRIRGLLGDL